MSFVSRERHINIAAVSAWDEIYEVFGDGHDYDWALVEDEDVGLEEDVPKGEMKYQDVRIWLAYCDSILNTLHRYSNHPRYVSGC